MEIKAMELGLNPAETPATSVMNLIIHTEADDG